MLSPPELSLVSDAAELPGCSPPETSEDEYLACIKLQPTDGRVRKRPFSRPASRPTVATSGTRRRHDLWDSGAAVRSPALLQCCRSTLALDDALIAQGSGVVLATKVS